MEFVTPTLIASTPLRPETSWLHSFVLPNLQLRHKSSPCLLAVFIHTSKESKPPACYSWNTTPKCPPGAPHWTIPVWLFAAPFSGSFRHVTLGRGDHHAQRRGASQTERTGTESVSGPTLLQTPVLDVDLTLDGIHLIRIWRLFTTQGGWIFSLRSLRGARFTPFYHLSIVKMLDMPCATVHLLTLKNGACT
jgi:hypothetical protein